MTDCLSAALVALKAIGITLLTIPSIGVSPEWGKAGYSNLSGWGVVLIRDANDCTALVHELIHHKQTEVYGWTTDKMENYKREQDASRLTMWAIQAYGVNEWRKLGT